MNKKFEIQDLELSNRCEIFLKNNQITNISSLCRFSAGDLRKMKGCTPSVILELRKKMAFHGFCLFGDVVIKSPASVEISQEIPKMLSDLQNQLIYMSNYVESFSWKILELHKKLDIIISSEQYKNDY